MLKDLGVVINLDHQTRCSLPQKSHPSLRILDSTGVHKVTLFFCGCQGANPHYIQLLRRGLYPATLAQGKIKTVATFRYLEQLHLSILTTKCSVYDFYRAISKLTDNSGLTWVPWRYHALMRMCLQWRHLKLLKRNGRGNEASGIAGAEEGSLVVPCPSCPHPGINLPDDWVTDTKHRDYYSVKLTEDANFRLKEQLVSSHSRDPGLVDGLGYFVGRVKYEQYVISRASDEDVSAKLLFCATIRAAELSFRSALV